MKVFETFSGYGGASFALKKANINYQVVGFSEVNKFAIQCYEQTFPGIAKAMAEQWSKVLNQEN